MYGLTEDQLTAIAHLLPHVSGRSMTVLARGDQAARTSGYNLGARFTLYDSCVGVRPISKVSLGVVTTTRTIKEFVPLKAWNRKYLKESK